FVPFLSGIPAEEVDFSPNGQWITYADIPDGTLWRSRVDGSERLQLTYPPVSSTLPRWSPDGKQIVLCTTQPGKPWNLSLVSAQGGAVQELLSENRSLVDPTWSPDGRQIVFGGSGDPEDYEIRILDLNSHQLSTVPGSKGLFSPRWSPDGHYLAALSGDSQKLMLYDFKTQKWAVWADEGHTVGFPNWSRDSRYVYFDWFFGKDQSYRRVKVGGNKSEDCLARRGFAGISIGLDPGAASHLMARLCLSAILALRKFMLSSCSSPDTFAIRSSLVCLRKEICRHPCPDEYHEPTHPSLWQPEGVVGAEVSTDDCPQNHNRGMRPKDSPSHNEDEHGNAVDRAT